MSLADYLAKNYLTEDSKPEKRAKKRKRKDGVQSGLVIADDDVSGWKTNGTGGADEDAPLTGMFVSILLANGCTLICPSSQQHQRRIPPNQTQQLANGWRARTLILGPSGRRRHHRLRGG